MLLDHTVYRAIGYTTPIVTYLVRQGLHVDRGGDASWTPHAHGSGFTPAGEALSITGPEETPVPRGLVLSPISFRRFLPLRMSTST